MRRRRSAAIRLRRQPRRARNRSVITSGWGFRWRTRRSPWWDSGETSACPGLWLWDGVAYQQFDGSPIAGAPGGAGMLPGCAAITAHGVNLGERDVGIGIAGIESHGFQQQAQRFFLAVLHSIQLRKIVKRARVRRILRNRGPLLRDMAGRLLIEREIDDFLAPEAHCCDPTKTRRTSITLVWVGPVLTRSPSASK